jgi:hypothetical protein
MISSLPRKIEDRLLREDRMHNPVKLTGRGEITPEWLLDDDPRVTGQSRFAESRYHNLEQRWRDRKVVRRTAGARERLGKRTERPGLAIVAVHIPNNDSNDPARPGHRYTSSCAMHRMVRGAASCT